MALALSPIMSRTAFSETAIRDTLMMWLTSGISPAGRRRKEIMSAIDIKISQLFAFIAKKNDAELLQTWDEELPLPIANKAAVSFELYAWRSFVVDFMAYSIYADTETRAELCEPLFTRIRRHAEQEWEEGGQGLEQRLALYAHAVHEHPVEPDTAILSMFCKLCGRADEPFRRKAPELLLRYVKDIREIMLPQPQ
jgi:hypothetical protein